MNKVERAMEALYKYDYIGDRSVQSAMNLVNEMKSIFEDEDNQQLKQLKKNILTMDMAMDDAPYFGISKKTIDTIRHTINELLKNTGITTSDLIHEMDEKGWFQNN